MKYVDDDHDIIRVTDSGEVEDYEPRRPFKVLVQDETGERWSVEVNAYGIHDARNLGREAAYDAGFIQPAVLRVEEVAA